MQARGGLERAGGSAAELLHAGARCPGGQRTPAADARRAQVLAFLAAGVVLVLAFRKFGGMDLTEFQIMMAVLATMSLSLLCVLLGLVCGRKPEAAF